MTVENKNNNNNKKEDEELDKKNMIRGWGWSLFPLGHPIFKEPEYLQELLLQNDDKALISDKIRRDKRIKTRFADAWTSIAPNNVTVPQHFYLNGSDTNNSIFDLITDIYNKIHRAKEKDVILLFMDKIWGGSRGRIRKMGFMEPDKIYNPYRIESPHSCYFTPTDPEEITRLEKIEKKALDKIKDFLKHKSDKTPIGGLLLEAILGPYGVYFYRSCFLSKLRKLCDEYSIPIICDEILTGGGRTGKFFAYQHYTDFEPDFITFGKGLLISGITKVDRKDAPYHYSLPKLIVFGPTLYHYHEILIKATQILKGLVKYNVLDNVLQQGDYFLDKLREINYSKNNKKCDCHKCKEGVKTRIRGKGLLLYIRSKDNYTDIKTGMGRIMPYLTISKIEIDNLI